MLSELYCESKLGGGMLAELFQETTPRKKIKENKMVLDNETRVRKEVSELMGKKTCCLDKLSMEEMVLLRKQYQGLKTMSKKLFITTFVRTCTDGETTINNKRCCFSCYTLVHGITSYKIRQAKRSIKENTLMNEEQHGNKDKVFNTKKKEQTFAWFENFLEYDGQYAPTKSEIHLSSCFTWSDIYQNYRRDVDHPYKNITQFTRIIREKFPNVVLPKCTRLGKCQDCIELKLKLSKQKSISDKELVRKELEKHTELHTKERFLYSKRSQKAKKFPDEMESIIIDGAEGLLFPNVYPVPKGVNLANCLKVGCYGLIAHGSGDRQLKLILPIFRCGANLSCTILFEYLRERRHTNSLPRMLYLQADNCYKEIKNRYTIGLLALLIHYGWCDEIIVSTMIAGHTHADIDQMFSTYSQGIEKGSATSSIATPDEFMVNMKDYYKEEKTRPVVSYLQRMYDWADYFDDANEGCLLEFKGISAFHGFRLFKKNNQPVLQLKQYSHTPPEDEYHGPDLQSSSHYIIFNESKIPKGRPELLPSIDIDKHILSDLSAYNNLIDEKAQQWLKQCKESNGKFILDNTIPVDFWLEQVHSLTVNVCSTPLLPEKVVNMTTARKSKKLHKPPSKQPTQYCKDEFLLIWVGDSLEYELGQVAYVDSSWVSIIVFKLKEGGMIGPPHRLMTLDSSNLCSVVMLRAIRLVKDNKLDARVVAEVQLLIKKKKKDQEEKEETEKKRKREEEKQAKKNKKNKPSTTQQQTDTQPEANSTKRGRGRPKKK